MQSHNCLVEMYDNELIKVTYVVAQQSCGKMLWYWEDVKDNVDHRLCPNYMNPSFAARFGKNIYIYTPTHTQYVMIWNWDFYFGHLLGYWGSSVNMERENLQMLWMLSIMYICDGGKRW